MRVPAATDSAFQATTFAVVLISAFAFRAPALGAAYVLLAIGIVLANVRVFSASTVKERNAAAVYVIVVTVMLPISAIRSEVAIVHYVVALASMGAALVFTRDLHIYRKASQIALVAAQVAVIGYLARSGLAGFPLEDMLPGSSANGVTSYLVLLQANYSAINYAMTRRASLVTAATTLFICFVGWGRGSILAAAALVAVALLSKASGRSHAATLLRLLVLIGAGMVLYATYSEVIGEAVSGTKIGAGLYDPSRAAMIHEYLSKVDPVTLLTGAGYEGTSIPGLYNGNPHNSFIRAHHIFGLPYLLAVLLLPGYLIHRAHATAVKLFCACVWFVVLFRSFTEPVLFPTFLDYFYFATCLALSQPPPQPEAGRLPSAVNHEHEELLSQELQPH